SAVDGDDPAGRQAWSGAVRSGAHRHRVAAMSTITVWCDDASHPAKRERVFIAEFSKPNIVWMPKAQRRNHPGVKWWREDGGGLHVEPDAGEWRLTHYSMSCRQCGDSLTLRPGKLDAVMELTATAGRRDVTLAELRSILEMLRK